MHSGPFWPEEAVDPIKASLDEFIRRPESRYRPKSILGIQSASTSENTWVLKAGFDHSSSMSASSTFTSGISVAEGVPLFGGRSDFFDHLSQFTKPIGKFLGTSITTGGRIANGIGLLLYSSELGNGELKQEYLYSSEAEGSFGANKKPMAYAFERYEKNTSDNGKLEFDRTFVEGVAGFSFNSPPPPDDEDIFDIG